MRAVFFHTPLGWAGAAVSDSGIRAVILPASERNEVEGKLARAGCELSAADDRAASGALLRKAVSRLGRYFSGKSVTFDLLLDLRHYTPFQQAVWRATASIPYGETRSYAWIAKKIGRPKAVRAVGSALGVNPVPVLIP